MRRIPRKKKILFSLQKRHLEHLHLLLEGLEVLDEGRAIAAKVVRNESVEAARQVLQRRVVARVQGLLDLLRGCCVSHWSGPGVGGVGAGQRRREKVKRGSRGDGM